MGWANNIQNRERVVMLSLGIGLCIVMLFPEFAFAGEDGKAFGDVWEMICLWIKGGLGKLICGTAIVIGFIFGAARQSLAAFGVGVGIGVGLYNTPAIVKSIFGVAISSNSFGIQLIEMFSNGLN